MADVQLMDSGNRSNCLNVMIMQTVPGVDHQAKLAGVGDGLADTLQRLLLLGPLGIGLDESNSY